MSSCKCLEFCMTRIDRHDFESHCRHLNAHVSWNSCDFSLNTVSQCWHSSHCSHKLCISLLLTNNINNRDSILVTCDVRIREFSLVSVSNACLVYLHAATKETRNWVKCKELDELLHSTSLSECASLHCSLMWTPLYLTQFCARIQYFHPFTVFG